MNEVVYNWKWFEVTYIGKIYDTAYCSINNNDDVFTWPYIYANNIKESWVHDKLNTVNTIVENDFYGFHVRYNTVKGCSDTDILDIHSVILTIDKNILIMDELISFINDIPNIELLTFGFSRINMFFFIFITAHRFNTPIDLEDGYPNNVKIYIDKLNHID